MLKETKHIADKHRKIIKLLKGQGRECVIYDIDGCLLDSEMSHLYDREIAKGDFKWFHDMLPKFQPFKWAKLFVQSFRWGHIDTVFLTARNEDFEEITKQTLLKHFGITIDNKSVFLFMRPSADERGSVPLKLDYWNQVISKIWKPIFAIDDRKNITEMWKKLGVPSFHIQDPSSEYADMVLKTKTYKGKDLYYDVTLAEAFIFLEPSDEKPDLEEEITINDRMVTVFTRGAYAQELTRVYFRTNKKFRIDEHGCLFEELEGGGLLYFGKVNMDLAYG